MQVDGKQGKKSKGNTAKAATRRERSVTWFNPKPSSKDVEWLDSRESEYVEFLVVLVTELRVGERLSVKYDHHSTRWLAILFIDPDSEGFPVQALSVRGATALDACVLLYYFNYVKFSEGWESDSPVNTGRFG